MFFFHCEWQTFPMISLLLRLPLNAKVVLTANIDVNARGRELHIKVEISIAVGMNLKA